MPNTPVKRALRKEQVGRVISDKMTKTIIVRVERRYAHPKYRKVISGARKFYAHDEQREARVGDLVRIKETRPLSKTKCWRLVAIVERHSEVAPVNVN